MEKTDAKVRLFLELSNPRQIQILNYLPLKSFQDWNPERMYEHPKSQYYYAFINEEELISRMKDLFLSDNQNIEKEILEIKEELRMSKISIEFNGCNVETFEDIERNRQRVSIFNDNEEENNTSRISNVITDEKYVVFCRFLLKNFGFIHNYEKLSREDMNKLFEKPVIYALKGRIKSLLNIRKKELDTKNRDVDITNVISNEEDRNLISNDAQNKKDSGDKNNIYNIKGIDGHWFLINSYENIDFLSLIKYKEKTIAELEQEKANTSVTNNTSNISNQNQSQNQSQNQIQNQIQNQNQNIIPNDKYTNPHLFSYKIKDTKKYVTVYQNKSCKYHHNKNEFICKDCSDFCCLECFDENAKFNNHFGHKIALIDELMSKFEEDTKFLDERIQYLKTIIENEITDKKAEIGAIKGKNEATVNTINTENDKIRAIIKREQINRAKVLGFLGNEALRIINDFNLKIRYIKILNDKGDMSTYLTNYFFFEKFYKKEIKKNLFVLEKKIKETEEKFNDYNNKLHKIVDDLKKTL